MTTLVSSVFNKVKEVPFVNRSLAFAQVTKEIVTDTYSNNSTKAEYINDIKTKLFSLDKVYLEAYKKVTHEKEDDIKNKIEYKFVNFSSGSIRTIKEKTEEGYTKISNAKGDLQTKIHNKKQALVDKWEEQKSTIKNFLVTNKDKVSNTINVKITSAKNKVESIKSKSVCLSRSLKDGVKARAVSLKDRVSEEIEKRLQSERLKDILTYMGDKYTKINKLTKEQADYLRQGFSTAHKYLTDQVTSSKMTKYVVSSTKAQLEHFKNALDFIKETFYQNTVSVKKLADRNGKFLDSVKTKNKQIFSYMGSENKRLMTNYVKKLELELYYSPEESVKLVDKFKSLFALVWEKLSFHKKSGEEETEESKQN